MLEKSRFGSTGVSERFLSAFRSSFFLFFWMFSTGDRSKDRTKGSYPQTSTLVSPFPTSSSLRLTEGCRWFFTNFRFPGIFLFFPLTLSFFFDFPRIFFYTPQFFFPFDSRTVRMVMHTTERPFSHCALPCSIFLSWGKGQKPLTLNTQNSPPFLFQHPS